MKNMLCIHDICTYSRSSLNIVIPTLSMIGIEPLPLPTALLSTQTDGFNNYYIANLTSSMECIIKNLNNNLANINSVYSGYLPNDEACKIVRNIIFEVKPKLFVLDPVLSDNGELYRGFDKSMVEGMKSLAMLCDVMTPNYSEALLLLDIPYKKNISTIEIESMALELSRKFKCNVVITSVPLANSFANIIVENGEIEIIKFDESKVHYPGCGDFFASILSSLLLKGYDLLLASSKATEISSKAVKISKKNSREERLGVSIETVRKDLVDLI